MKKIQNIDFKFFKQLWMTRFFHLHMEMRLKKHIKSDFFSSSDGDKKIDNEHEKAFEEYEIMMEKGASFKELVAVVGNHDSDSPWPIYTI